MSPTTAEAVAASVAVAVALGLPSEQPAVVAEGYSVRVRLDPAPVLTRVVTVGQTLRGQPLPWFQSAGAPVAAPWWNAGPHHAGDLDVSLWQWLEPDTQPPEV